MMTHKYIKVIRSVAALRAIGEVVTASKVAAMIIHSPQWTRVLLKRCANAGFIERVAHFDEGSIAGCVYTYDITQEGQDYVETWF